jgi:uncharacterized protein (TIGR00297 family)
MFGAGSGAEIARKSVHVSMGAFALLLAYLNWWQAALMALAALGNNLFVLPRIGGRRLFREAARLARHDVGIVLYPLSVLLLVLVFPGHLGIVAAAWGFMAAGDGMAGVVGRLIGARTGRLPWNPDKSWAGLLAFVAAGVPAAAGLYLWVAREPVPVAVAWGGCLAVGAIVAVLESLRLGIDDNLLVPLASGGLLYAALEVVAPALPLGPEMLALVAARLPWALGANVLVGLAAWRAGSVDRSGLIHGVLLGTGIWVFGSWAAFAMLALFFVLGTGATKVGYRTKAVEGTAQEKGGRRGAANAWANAGAGLLFAVLAGVTGSGLFAVALVAAFATATADTLGSEIGQAYGRRTFLITTFKPVPRGTDGAVSLEGTLAGIAGAVLLALAGRGLGLLGGADAVLAVVVAAVVGTTLESYLGALLERAAMIDNEAQNFLNTLVGGLVALALVAWAF